MACLRARAMLETHAMACSSWWSVRGSRVMLGLFLAVLAAEHLLQPGLDPDRHRISEYVNGSPGWLMTVGFGAWALSLALTALALGHAQLRPSQSSNGVVVLLGVAAVAALLTAVFRTGTSAGVVLPGHHLSDANRVHDLGSGVLAVVLWCAVAASLVSADRGLRSQSVRSLVVGIAGALTLSGAGLPGIGQRLLVVVACVWQYALLAAIARSGLRQAGPS